jgi:hypothetical protein
VNGQSSEVKNGSVVIRNAATARDEHHLLVDEFLDPELLQQPLVGAAAGRVSKRVRQRESPVFTGSEFMVRCSKDKRPRSRTSWASDAGGAAFELYRAFEQDGAENQEARRRNGITSVEIARADTGFPKKIPQHWSLPWSSSSALREMA